MRAATSRTRPRLHLRSRHRRHRLLREPGRHARAHQQRASPSGPTNDFGEISVVADTAPTPGCAPRAAACVISAGDFNPERVVPRRRASSPPPIGRTSATRSRSVTSASSTTASATSSCCHTEPPRGRRAAACRPRSRARQAAGPAHDRVLQRREPAPRTTRPRSSPRWPRRSSPTCASPDIVALKEIQDNNGADQRRRGRRGADLQHC